MNGPTRMIILLLLAGSETGTAQEIRNNTNATEAIKQFKLIDLPAAYRTQDTVALRSMLADRYERIGLNGERTSKEEEIARAGRTKPTYDTLWFDIRRLDIFENGTAIVSGTGNVRGRDEQGSYAMTYASSNTLMMIGGRWLLVASHVSGSAIERVR